jgi:hypothetical protein
VTATCAHCGRELGDDGWKSLSFMDGLNTISVELCDGAGGSCFEMVHRHAEKLGEPIRAKKKTKVRRMKSTYRRAPFDDRSEEEILRTYGVPAAIRPDIAEGEYKTKGQNARNTRRES